MLHADPAACMLFQSLGWLAAGPVSVVFGEGGEQRHTGGVGDGSGGEIALPGGGLALRTHHPLAEVGEPVALGLDGRLEPLLPDKKYHACNINLNNKAPVSQPGPLFSG